MKTPTVSLQKPKTHKDGGPLKNSEESLYIKDHNFQLFSAARDRHTDVRDTVQLAVFVCGVNMQFNINDRLSSCQ
jgi:hypothetical protein